MNLKARDFHDALLQIPTGEGVEFVGTFFQTAEAKNLILAEYVREGNFFWHEYPEQLNFRAALRWGSQMFYGYGDNPKNALLNAINSYFNRTQIVREGDDAAPNPPPNLWRDDIRKD